MKCPLCGKDLRVMETKEVDRHGYKVSRRRECRDQGCGYVAYTSEILAEYWQTIEGLSEARRLERKI